MLNQNSDRMPERTCDPTVSLPTSRCVYLRVEDAIVHVWKRSPRSDL